jgi:hypothetical protein
VLLVVLTASVLLTAGFEAVGQGKKGKKDKTTAKDKKPPAKAEIDNDLFLDVQALQMLHDLRATPGQLRRLIKLAASTAPKPESRKFIKASAELRKALVGLRGALLNADQEKIDQLADTFAELRDKEDVDFDDIEPTEAARKQAPLVVRVFSARQLAGYMGSVAEEIPDPGERLRDALAGSRKLKDSAWRSLRDRTAEQVAGVVAGLDKTVNEKKLLADVKALLERAHRLDAKDKEFKSKMAGEQKKALELVAKVRPFAVMRLFTERAMAELLANPRLATMAGARLKKITAEKPPKKKG